MTIHLKPIPNTDLLVSDLCLGTMTWGAATPAADAHAQADLALAAGINFIDTAEVYPVPASAPTMGETESILGQWLRGQDRGRLVIATKVTGSGRPELLREGRDNLCAENIARAAEDSLRRLGTDYIDLYQIHTPARHAPRWGAMGYTPRDDADAVPIEEQVQAIGRLLRDGKIRHWGLCNETPWGVMRFRQVCAQVGVAPPVTVQNGYNLVERSFELGLSEICHRETMGLLAYSPLAGGVLTGKYARGQRPAGSRFDGNRGYADRWIGPRALRAAEAYAELARSRGWAPEQLALAFVRQRWFLTAALVGASTSTMLASNLSGADLLLDEEILAAIDAIHND